MMSFHMCFAKATKIDSKNKDAMNNVVYLTVDLAQNPQWVISIESLARISTKLVQLTVK